MCQHQEEQKINELPENDHQENVNVSPQTHETNQAVVPESENNNQEIMSLETFRKRTNRNLESRNNTLENIDKALKDFKDYEENIKELEESNNEENEDNQQSNHSENVIISLHKLNWLKDVCEKWIDEHKKKESVYYNPIEDLMTSVDLRIVAQREVLRQTFSDKPDEFKENILHYESEATLPPYKEFYDRMNEPEILWSFKLSSMRKTFNKDEISKDHKYLHEILNQYEEFDDIKKDEKEITEEGIALKYKKLLDLEKSCNDWLYAHRSKKGKLYAIMTLAATPSTVRRNYISQLVKKGGAIDKEKCMIEGSLNAFRGVQNKDSTKLKNHVHSELPEEIYDLDTFLDFTKVQWFNDSRVGKNLLAIELAILDYHENKDEEKEKEYLENIFRTTTHWLAIHKEGTEASVQHRLPIIRDLAGISKKLLQKRYKLKSEDVEKMDERVSADAIFENEGMLVTQRDIPTIGHFKKLTKEYTGIFSGKAGRGENLTAIDNEIIEYHKCNEGDIEKRKKILQNMKKSANKWLRIHGIDKEKKDNSAAKRYEVIKDLKKKIKILLDNMNVESDANDVSSSEMDTSVQGIPRIEEFKEMTYVKRAKRGENIKAIDNEIIEYHKCDEGDIERRKIILQNMKKTTRKWLRIHGIDKEKKNNSATKRYPAIKGLYKQIKRLLDNMNTENTVDTESTVDTQNNISTQNPESPSKMDTLIKGKTKGIPTIDQFDKLTNGEKDVKKIYNSLLAYDKLRMKSEYNEAAQKKVGNVLKNLYEVCDNWINSHTNSGDGNIGKCKSIIEKMIGEEGLIAQESAILMRDKVLSKDVGLNSEFIQQKKGNLQDLFDIKDKYSEKLGKETANINTEVGVSLGFPGLHSLISVGGTIKHTRDGVKEGYIDNYNKAISEKKITKDNIRYDIDTNHKTTLELFGKFAYLIKLKVKGGIGGYTKASADTVDDCTKLIKFSTYNNCFRTKWLKKIVENEEKIGTTISEVSAILLKNEKNYIEDGNIANAGGSAGITMIGEAQGEVDKLWDRKKINKDTVLKAVESISDKNEAFTDEKIREALKDNAEDETKDEELSSMRRTKRVAKPGAIIDLLEKPEITTIFEAGKLANKRLEVGIDTDEDLTKYSIPNMSIGLINQLSASFEEENKDKENEDYFNMNELNLNSFSAKIADAVENYPPILQMRNHAFRSFITGLSAKVVVELDAKKGVLKLLIKALNFKKNLKEVGAEVGVGVASALPGINVGDEQNKVSFVVKPYEMAKKGIDMLTHKDITNNIKLKWGLIAGMEINDTTEELLGFWKLPNSHFQI